MYKVGDKVIIIKERRNIDNTSGTKHTIGKTGTIVDIHTFALTSECFLISFEKNPRADDYDAWWYTFDMFESLRKSKLEKILSI